MTKPTLVVFDLDDTLYEYGPANEAALQATYRFANDELGVKEPAFSNALSIARERVKLRLGNVASSHSRLLYFHEVLEILGLRSEPQVALSLEQEFWRNYLLAITLRDGARELLSTLRYHNVTTALVTDLTAQIQFRKLTYLELTNSFDHVVCSEETAGEKSSGLPFELLFERVDSELLKEVWFIGDQLFDAPVERLLAQDRIQGGRGFVRGGQATTHVAGWKSFAEIESAVDKVFRTVTR